MSRKKWGLFFLAALALIIAAWAAVNILVDPFGVYGDVLFHWDSYSQTLNSRNGKAAYLSQHFEDYDSYVIGSGAASAYHGYIDGFLNGLACFRGFNLNGAQSVHICSG